MSQTTTFAQNFFKRMGLQITSTKGRWGVDLDNDLCRLVNPGGVVLDIGANEGQSARWLHGLLKDVKIHSFEPSSSMFPALQKNTAALTGVNIWKLGVGEAAGEMQFNIFENECLNSLHEMVDDPSNPFYGEKRKRVETIKVVSVDDFVNQQKIDRVELLKVDTQGYDYQVLLGAQRLFVEKRIRAVLVEVNFAPIYEKQRGFEDFVSLLRENGLGLVGLYGGSRLDGVLRWADALFTLIPDRST